MNSITLYTVIDNGCDGRQPDTIIHCSSDKQERDSWLEQHPSKAWFRKGERTHSLEGLYAKLTLSEKEALKQLLSAREPTNNEIVGYVIKVGDGYVKDRNHPQMGTVDLSEADFIELWIGYESKYKSLINLALLPNEHHVLRAIRTKDGIKLVNIFTI